MMIQKLAAVFFFSAVSLSANASAFETFYENSSGSPIFKLLQSAKSSIDIEIYEIEDLRVQSAVINALKRGVKVRVVQESKAVGTNCSVFEKVHLNDTPDCRGQKVFIQTVRSLGGSYVPYAYQQLCNGDQCLEHGKMILVDDQKAMISTGNFNASNLCDPKGLPQGDLTTCNRDYTVVSTDSKVVNTLATIFNADFKGNAYNLPHILESMIPQRVTVSPLSMNPILEFIASAKKSIVLENQYLKNYAMNDALIAAAKRGVKVYVMVSSICAFGKPDPQSNASAIANWKNSFTAFDQAGVKSRIFTKSIPIKGYHGYLHSKAMVVDGVRAWVGSVNGSTQALTQNREYGIFMNDPTQVSKLLKVMKDDFNHPNSESWRESLDCKKD